MWWIGRRQAFTAQCVRLWQLRLQAGAKGTIVVLGFWHVAQLLYGYEKPWTTMKLQAPYGFGTDCRSLYETTVKTGSSTREKRIAMDLQDVRDGIDEGGKARWIPTEVMLVDGLAKRMTSQDLIENTLLKGRYGMWCNNVEGLYNREEDLYAEIEILAKKKKT